ncbi:hypothetical protein KKF84_20450 [Myxococcota bacterium]|nr:hypothetical protein [Myxococcota bacterium]
MEPYVIDEVPGLYRVLQLKAFRHTPGVDFDQYPIPSLESIDGIDRVIHSSAAISPGPVGEVERPWYMHPNQADNLLVLHGTRFVDIYTPAHGKVEHFEVTPEKVYKNGELIAEVGAVLVWPRGVFHRIRSGDSGSASVNIARHYKGFDIRTNFSIYQVDTKTGEFSVIREGHMDQME